MNDSQRERKREYNKKYYQLNKEKRREQNRKWNEENKDKQREYRRKWEKENKEKRIEEKRKYREDNKEYWIKYRELNKKKLREQKRKWDGEHKEQKREYAKAQRDERRAHCREYLGGKCVKCGTTHNLQFDHIKREGKKYTIASRIHQNFTILKEELDKCQLLCVDCHLEKTAKEWEIGRASCRERV